MKISEITVNMPIITEDNQLIIPEDLSTLTLAVIRPTVEKYAEINASLVFDYREKDGNKQARSHVAKLRKIKAPVEAVHKALKAEYKAITDTMDKDKRELLQVIESMIAVHADPLKEVEAEEAEVERLQKIESEIVAVWDHAHELNEMVDQQRALEKQAAEQAMIAKEQEAKQREIERIERERVIAEQAAESARLQAEAKAARDKIEAQERELKAAEVATQALKSAEERAAREKIEAEARHQRELAEQQQRLESEKSKLEQEERRASSDKENIKMVNRSILIAMVGFGIDETAAKNFIVAVKSGAVAHLQIKYKDEA